MVFVDPKSRNIARYRGATVITPNLKEATEATLSNDVIKAGKHLMNDKMSDAILITEGENGMTLFEKAAKPIHFDALALDIFDVTGAGDTVIAAFAVAAASGCAFSEAARIANIAASIAVGHIGTTVVTSEQIKEFCSDAAVASSS